MQECVFLEIKTQDNAQANAIAEKIKNYLNASFEDRVAEWGNGIKVRDNVVVNNCESRMYYFDYEDLKERLFERIARDLPDITFDGSCEYSNDDGDPPSNFRKVYCDGILSEVGKNKKAKLIYCSKSYSGQYVMPASVNQICDGAFRDCRSLEVVFVSETVKKIGKDTFSGCDNLSQIHIPNSVGKIVGKTVFKGCTKLTIHAPIGSYAETYAKENNIPFVEE